MLSTTTYPLSQHWFPKLGQQLHSWIITLTPPPAQQHQLQPGDSYFLEAGNYRLRVLTGTIWVPTVGIFQAGETLTLTVDTAGLAIHTYAQQAVVFTQRAA